MSTPPIGTANGTRQSAPHDAVPANQTIGRAAAVAAEAIRNVNAVQAAAAPNRNQLAHDTILSFLGAAYNGRHDVFFPLLDSDSISEEICSEALKYAAGGGQLDILNVLLARGPIEEEFRGYALGNGASEGHFDIVNAVLNSGPFSGEWCIRAARLAKKYGHHDLATLLEYESNKYILK
jgi:hypothetical protein